ncbi:glycerate kinase [Algoriphagus sp.]|uniref:glycerate kinase family protein n=1 Tax=Algoriphagus sp. TaxID=1872435 RepID=UPI00326AA5E7
MNVLISPNAFKGTMSAQEAGGIIQDFLASKFPKVQSQLLPIADGGDGTCDLLTRNLGVEQRQAWSLDPYGRPISCTYGWDLHEEKAYIDVSEASGIAILGNEKKDPYIASTYGTGILVRDAVALGAKEIVLGLGGSATIDLGIGILANLGVIFLDENGRELTYFSPNFLSRIRHIQKSPNIPPVRFTCLCDVKNMFFGDNGAIPVFGPQKGLLDNHFQTYLASCEEVIAQVYKKQKKNFVDQPGFGAAGGIAVGLSAFFDTTIEFGASYFFKKVKIVEKVKWADVIITGEGRYDSQSAEGKACFELLQLALHQSKKVVLITSGIEKADEKFDQVLRLPDLDFSKQDFKESSRKNLITLLEREFLLDV